MSLNHIRIRLFIALQHCLPQHALSRLAGKLANSERAWLKNLLIRCFASHYRVNMQEAAEPDCTQYKSFNHFFTRALDPSSRHVEPSPPGICSPADGEISQLGKIQQQALVQAKGRFFTLGSLLAFDNTLAERFYNGEFATIYLSPKDYHRVHMPCDGTLVKTTYVPGKLFSVNNDTAQAVEGLFARNERLICEFDTPHGKMAMILVGAMIVAAIETTWYDYSLSPGRTASIETHNGPAFRKGDEMGRFKLGSTVILLFEEGAVQWHDGAQPGTAVKMGELLANVGSS